MRPVSPSLRGGGQQEARWIGHAGSHAPYLLIEPFDLAHDVLLFQIDVEEYPASLVFADASGDEGLQGGLKTVVGRPRGQGSGQTGRVSCRMRSPGTMISLKSLPSAVRTNSQEWKYPIPMSSSRRV